MSILCTDKKAERVHDLFENIAPKYDIMNTVLSFALHKRWRKLAIEKMKLSPGNSVIDLCCGTGDWTLDSARAVLDGEVVGVDFSANMLHYAQNKIEKSGLNHQITLTQADVTNLTFADNSFDAATIGFALRNVSDFKKVLCEMKRVVKPGGKVVSLELSKPTNKYWRGLYYFYFQRLLPLLGKLFASSYEQYKWLPESLVNFPEYEQLKNIMQDEISLNNVEVYPILNGVAAIHIGYKYE